MYQMIALIMLVVAVCLIAVCLCRRRDKDHTNRMFECHDPDEGVYSISYYCLSTMNTAPRQMAHARRHPQGKTRLNKAKHKTKPSRGKQLSRSASNLRLRS